MIQKAVICFFFLILMCSCEDRYDTINTCIALPDKEAHHDDTIMKDSIKGFYFSRLTEASSRGLQCNYTVPPELKNSELEIVFSGKIRTNFAVTNAFINVAAMSEDGAMASWNGLVLRYFITDINKWCPFKDSVHLKPESWHKPFHTIQTFSYRAGSTTEVVDVDSLTVVVKVKR